MNQNFHRARRDFIYYPYYAVSAKRSIMIVDRRLMHGLTENNDEKKILAAVECLTNRLIARIKPHGLIRRIPDFRSVRQCLQAFDYQVNYTLSRCFTLIRDYSFDLPD